MNNRIEELRRLKHVNQKDLGDAIGVAQTTISTWERGTRQPDHECLLRLADYFNVSTDYLLGRDIHPDSASDSYLVPVLGRVAAGLPLFAAQNRQELWIRRRSAHERIWLEP